MVLLQNKLNLRVSQKQILTPGLVQMVSVLALNKLELKEMINGEMIENPVLEEIEESVETVEERAGKEADRERSVEEVAAEGERVEKDPFDEIDFGSYFQDYLDPGFRTASNFEEYDKPSFENFLSQPSTLSDHLAWQLGSLTLSPEVRAATELVVGNLNEDGYLIATDEELVELLLQEREPVRPEPIPFERGSKGKLTHSWEKPDAESATEAVQDDGLEIAAAADEDVAPLLAAVREARALVNFLDPVGVGARDLRECLLIQICAQQGEAAIVLRRRQMTAAYGAAGNGDVAEENSARIEPAAVEEGSGHTDIFSIATHIVTNCLPLLQKKDMRELTRSCGRTPDDVNAAAEFIRTLDPRRGQRYNHSETRLIEPAVAFVKRDHVYTLVMNEGDI